MVYRDGGDDGLRGKLASLSVYELKDIIAEHGMDCDKLAMRWKTATRLQDRIVERVIARESKGDAFRQESAPTVRIEAVVVVAAATESAATTTASTVAQLFVPRDQLFRSRTT